MNVGRNVLGSFYFPRNQSRCSRLISTSLLTLITFMTSYATAAQVDWIANVDGDWHVAGNWSSGIVPQPGDDVRVDGAFAVTYSIDALQINSLTLAGDLRLTGGDLTLTGPSSINGLLSIQNEATLTAKGELATVNVLTSASIINGNLIALDGAQVALPVATIYHGNGLLQAKGVGSRLELDNVESIGVGLPGPLVMKEIFSRELSLYHAPDTLDETAALGLTTAYSREFTTYHSPLDNEAPALGLTTAYSREFTTYHSALGDETTALGLTTAYSREFTTYHSALVDETTALGLSTAYSREFTAYQSPLGDGINTPVVSEFAISREHSLYQRAIDETSESSVGVRRVASREFSLYMPAQGESTLTDSRSAVSRQSSVEHLSP